MTECMSRTLAFQLLRSKRAARAVPAFSHTRGNTPAGLQSAQAAETVDRVPQLNPRIDAGTPGPAQLPNPRSSPVLRRSSSPLPALSSDMTSPAAARTPRAGINQLARRAASTGPSGVPSDTETVFPTTPARMPEGVISAEAYRRGLAIRGSSVELAIPNIGPLARRTRPNSHTYRKETPRSPHTGASEDSFPEAPPPTAYQDVFDVSDTGGEGSAGNSLIVATTGPSESDLAAGCDYMDEDDSLPSRHQGSPRHAIKVVVARMPEYGRNYHDTPLRREISNGDQFLDRHTKRSYTDMEHATPPSPIAEGRFDIGLASHAPPPSVIEKGAPWDSAQVHEEEPLAPINSWWEGQAAKKNRFAQQAASIPANSATRALGDGACLAVASRRQPPRAVSTHRAATDGPIAGDPFEEGNKPFIPDSDLSDEEGDFVPPAGTEADEMDDLQTPSPEPPPAKSKGKGKARERNASPGPSETTRGRPTIEANKDIEEVGHRIQAELAALADKYGLSYDTVLRKVGLSPQAVREPTLGNVFRKVHKHRLLPEKHSAAQHNAAFSEWHKENGQDPEAIQALFTEHAKILADAPMSTKPSEVPKRVSSIAVQMAEMVNMISS